MTYRELIHLYKTGKLDEEQKEKVAKDIERQEAIGEYLFDEGEIPGFDTLENMDSIRIFKDDETDNNAGADEVLDEEKQFVKMINASIRKAFIKMGVTVSAIVIAVVLFVIFALPKLVDSFYYNPSEVAGSKTFYYSVGAANEDETGSEREKKSVVAETDRMSLDMAVYSELFLPGHYSDFVISDARGYGVHDIEIHSGMNKVAGKIDKNKLILYDMSVLNRPVVNCVYPEKANVFYSYILEDIEEQSKNMLDALQQLEDNKQYGVYVTFSDVYNYSELKQWSKENDLIFPQWCAICRKDEFETEGSATPYSADELIGFINGGSAHSMFYDKELYPNLTQYDLLKTTSEEKDWEISEEDMTTHVISILQYMKDQEVFNEMVGLEQQCRVFDTYQQLIDSIKNNGLIIYGFYGEATKEEILALSKSDDVAYIYTVPVE